MSYRILIVEDEPIIAEDLAITLEKEDYIIAGKAYNALQAIDMVVNRYPDLVLLDILLKGDKDGIDVGRIIAEKYRIPFIYITSFSDKSTLEKARTSLPSGYIVKPFRERDLIATIEMAMYRFAQENNQQPLDIRLINKWAVSAITPMEFHIINHLWEGKTNKEIATALYISVNTVKTHIKNIFVKCEVRSRGELMAALRRQGS